MINQSQMQKIFSGMVKPDGSDVKAITPLATMFIIALLFDDYLAYLHFINLWIIGFAKLKYFESNQLIEVCTFKEPTN